MLTPSKIVDETASCLIETLSRKGLLFLLCLTTAVSSWAQSQLPVPSDTGGSSQDHAGSHERRRSAPTRANIDLQVAGFSLSAQSELPAPIDIEVSSQDSSGSYELGSGAPTRTNVDLQVTGSVGAYPLRLTRNLWRFGLWSAYVTSIDPDSYYGQLIITTPEGRETAFWLFQDVTQVEGAVSPEERIVVSTTTLPSGHFCYEAFLPDGGKVVFGALDYSTFQTLYVEDPHGLRYTYEYPSSYHVQPQRIVDPSGRSISFSYSPTNGWITRAEGSDGSWVNYTYTSQSGRIDIDYSDGTHAVSKSGNWQTSDFDEPRLVAGLPKARYQTTSGLYAPHAMVLQPVSTFWLSTVANVDTGSPLSTRTLRLGSNGWRYSDRVTETRADGATRVLEYTPVEYSTDTWVKELRKVGDFLGNVYQYQYWGGGGTVYKVTNPRGHATTLLRNGPFYRITKKTAPDGSFEEWSYAQNNTRPFITSYKDARGNLTTCARLTNGLASRVDYPDGSYETWTYNAFNQATTHRLRNGATEWFDYDSSGRLLRHWLPSFSGQTSSVSYTYYPDGHAWEDRVWTQTDPLGHVTTFEYDLLFAGGVQTTTPAPGRGLVTKIINPDSTYKTWGYDPYGNKLWEENELRQRTSYQYDSYGRLVKITNPLGQETTHVYSALETSATIRETILPSGRRTAFYYDANLRKTEEVAAAGTADETHTWFEYDSVGNVTKVTQQVTGAANRVTTYEYDSRNRKTAEYAPLGRTTRWEYDAVGNVTKVTNPDGTFTTKTYDAMNRVATATDEMGYAVGFGYESGGQIDTITDRKGYHYRYEYDAAGQRTKLWYPSAAGGDNGSAESWAYAADGRVTDYNNRAGQHLHYTYDNRRRETLRAWDYSAAPSVSTGYDNASRVTTRANSTGTLSYSYDNAGRVTSETQAISGGPTVTVSFGYDADGLRTTRDATGESQLGFGYNARGQLTSVSYPGLSFGYAYDRSGARTLRTSPNGTASDYLYDGAGRLQTLDTYVVSGHANLLRQDFGRDLRDRRTWSLRDSAYGDSYVYQADSQLTEFRFSVWRPDQNPNGPPSVLDTYAYDQNGNRTSRNEGGAVTTYTANALNEYAAVSGASIAHSDGRGNVTQWQGWSYAYDAENRLVSATASGQSFAFAYDAQGRLAKLTKNGAAEYRYFDGGQLFLRKDAGATVLERVLWGGSPDEVLGRWTPAHGWHFFHQDPLNSPLLITNGSGAVLEKYLYDAYGMDLIFDAAGNARSVSALDNPWRFTGQEWIEGLALHNYKNRFYHDDLGRFLQQDPVRFDAGDFNLYRYCGNNPLNLSDPQGNEAANPDRRKNAEEDPDNVSSGESVKWNERVDNNTVGDLSKTTDPKALAVMNHFKNDAAANAQLKLAVADTLAGKTITQKILFIKTTVEKRRENAIYGFVRSNGAVHVVGTAQAPYEARGDKHSTTIPGFSYPKSSTPFTIHTHPWDEDTSSGDFAASNRGTGQYIFTVPVATKTVQVVFPKEGPVFEGPNTLLGLP